MKREDWRLSIVGTRAEGEKVLTIDECRLTIVGTQAEGEELLTIDECRLSNVDCGDSGRGRCKGRGEA